MPRPGCSSAARSVSFQAVKHKLAELFVEIAGASAAVQYASWAVDHDPGELPVAASLAQAYSSDAFWHAAAETVHLHGGIGFTWEHDAHMYFKRAKSAQVYLGDAGYHKQQLLRRLGVGRG